MAKERTSVTTSEEEANSSAEPIRVAVKKKFKKSKKKRDRRAKCSYCPNSSRSFHRSWRSESKVSKTALKKNNEDLAKNLNRYKNAFREKEKEVLRLEKEIMELKQENRIIRTQLDKAEEANINQFNKLKVYLNKAVDNMVGLQENLTQSMSVTNGTLRASMASRASRSSSLSSGSTLRTSSGPGIPVFGYSRIREASRQQQESPPKALPQSKVSPMVAGHTISRPRIQLTRMNLPSSVTQDASQMQGIDYQPPEMAGPNVDDDELNEPAVDDVEEEPHQPENMDQDLVQHEEDELEDQDLGEEEEGVDEEELPRRTRFNITVIREESRVESPVEEEVSIQQPTNSPSLTEDADESLDLSIRRRVKSTSRRVSKNRYLDFSVNVPPSPTEEANQGSSSTESSISSLLRCSPQVDILKSTRHPAVFLSNLSPHLSGSAQRATPGSSTLRRATPGSNTSDQSGPTSSSSRNREGNSSTVLVDTPLTAPIDAAPMPVAKPPLTISDEDFVNPSDSFLESLGCDPMEGPSWLFGSVQKKKKRRSAVKRLSSLMSDDAKPSSTGSLDTSDITSSEAEASGFLGTSTRLTGSPVDTSKFLKRLQSNGADSTDVSTEEEATLNIGAMVADDSDSENIPTHSQSVLGLTGDVGRSPLREIYLEPQGQIVTYNPKLDTGIVISDLKEAKILVENTRSTASKTPTTLKLSECYIDLSPGRRMSMEDVMKLGLSSICSPQLGNKSISSICSPETNRESALKRSLPLKKRSRTSAPPVEKSASLPGNSKLIPSIDDLSDKHSSPRNEVDIVEIQKAKESDLSILEPVLAQQRDSRGRRSKLSRSKRTSLTAESIEETGNGVMVHQEPCEPGPSSEPSSPSTILPNNEKDGLEHRAVTSSSGEEEDNNVEQSSGESTDEQKSASDEIGYRKSSRKTTLTRKMREAAGIDTPPKTTKRKQHSEPIPEKNRKKNSDDGPDEEIDINIVKKKAKSAAYEGKKSSKIDAPVPEVAVKAEDEVEEPPPAEGRRRRTAAQVSFKEPSLRGKMRQGDAGSSSIYADFKPKLKAKNSKKIEE